MARQGRARTARNITQTARYEALLEAAEAWEALSPQERHAFVCKYRNTIKVSSLPGAWLRIRASEVRQS